MKDYRIQFDWHVWLYQQYRIQWVIQDDHMWKWAESRLR